MSGIFRFFDKLEDHVRGWFSRRPILYGIVGGVGVVLFWRGVWHTADFASFTFLFPRPDTGTPTLDAPELWDGLLSMAIGGLLLLLIGIFVSNFIGNEIIISGLHGKKKFSEVAKDRLEEKIGAIAEIEGEVKEISKRLTDLESRIKR